MRTLKHTTKQVIIKAKIKKSKYSFDQAIGDLGIRIKK
jgi:hypothetical protein